MKLGNSEKPSIDSTPLSITATDTLAIFSGFLSLILIIILTTINLLLEPSTSPLEHTQAYSPAAVWNDCAVFFGVIVLVFLVSTQLNDVFITSRGKAGVLIASLIMGLVSSVLGVYGAPTLIVFGISATAISLLVLVWGAILSTISSTVLTFMLMLACVFAGFVVILDSQLSTTLTFVVIALLYLVSWQSIRHISITSLEQITFVTRRQSIERHVRGKGNRFTLVLAGSLLGITAVFTWNIKLAISELTLAIGICLLISGLIVSLFYKDLHSLFGNTIKRLLALIITVGLVPFPFAGDTGQLICVCFLFVAGIINLILIVDSILETSRFNQVSPFWIIGLEGSVFFAGILAVLLCSSLLMTLLSFGLEIMIFILVVASSVLQIYINNQAYPLFRRPGQNADIVSEEKTLEQKLKQEADDVAEEYAAFWRCRVDRLAEEYNLTTRQKEIMELLIMGRDLNYITVHLQISRPTAKTHLSNLYRKMNLHSKQELIDLMEPSENPEDLS